MGFGTASLADRVNWMMISCTIMLTRRMRRDKVPMSQNMVVRLLLPSRSNQAWFECILYPFLDFFCSMHYSFSRSWAELKAEPMEALLVRSFLIPRVNIRHMSILDEAAWTSEQKL